MLKVLIYANEDLIEKMTALNIAGNLNGTCEYEVNSKLYGDLGIISHFRPDMVHALVEKICHEANTKRKMCACNICDKIISGKDAVTVADEKMYHADCFYKDKMKKGNV
jgi:hypothetical protein